VLRTATITTLVKLPKRAIIHVLKLRSSESRRA
jgi:hypothetical protein